MKKDAFTLIELLSIIVVLGIITVLAVPRIGNNSDSKQKEYQKVIDLVENAGKVYFSSNRYISNVSVKTLQESGLLVNNLVNPIDDSKINGCVKMSVDSDGVLHYVYNNSCESREVNLTVDLNGGFLNQNFNSNYTTGDVIDLGLPSKEAAEFSKWKVIKGDSLIIDNKLIIGTEDTIIYATYEKLTRLTINFNGGISDQNFEVVYPSNTNLVLKQPRKTGYDFTGWEVIEGNSIVSGNSITIGEEDTTIKALYNIHTYTITYEMGEGTLDTPNPTTYTVESDDIVLNNPSHPNPFIFFVGWTGSNGLNPNTSISIVKGSTGDKTYTANYLMGVQFKYTGSFRVNGDSTTYPANSKYSTEWYTIPSLEYEISFLSSGTLTLHRAEYIQAFLVGGGGSRACGVMSNYDTYACRSGGGGFHKKFNYFAEADTSYTINVGGAGGSSSAFEQSVSAGGNARITSSDAYSGSSGTACGKFETAGSEYSGTDGSGANTGKPSSSGIIMIRNAEFSNFALYTGKCEVIESDGTTRTYTNQEIILNGENWRIKFLTSGKLILRDSFAADVFLVGGGGAGGSTSTGSGGAGGGGYTTTRRNFLLNGKVTYSITIGAGGKATTGSGNSGGTTSAFGLSAAGGRGAGASNANGGSGAGGYYGSDGWATGQGTTTCEFEESASYPNSGYRTDLTGCASGVDAYSGGGIIGYGGPNPGGGCSCAGGSCSSGKDNTGGGGCGYYYTCDYFGGDTCIKITGPSSGGSGVVVIRTAK